MALPLLRLLTQAREDLYPQRFGSFEPLRGRLTPESDIAVVLTDWGAPMLFSNGRRSDAWFGNKATHDAIVINCLASRVPAEIAAGLTRDLAVAADADLAVAYYWRGEREEWISQYKAVYPMCLGLTTHQLRRSLPDLAWYSVWGPPYVELFGRDRLASCPAFRSGSVFSKHWEVQLTDKPSAPKLSTAKGAVK